MIALKTDRKKPAIKGILGFCPRLLSLPDRQGNYGKTVELNEVNRPLRGARKAEWAGRVCSECSSPLHVPGGCHCHVGPSGLHRVTASNHTTTVRHARVKRFWVIHHKSDENFNKKKKKFWCHFSKVLDCAHYILLFSHQL